MWKIKVEDLKHLTNLCNELGINVDDYKTIKPDLVGKLIFDLCHLKIKGGDIIPPSPQDYQKGGKYDCQGNDE